MRTGVIGDAQKPIEGLDLPSCDLDLDCQNHYLLIEMFAPRDGINPANHSVTPSITAA
jgi:hypothetical protein